MKRTLLLSLALACLLIFASTFLACATPREPPTREPEQQSARQAPPRFDEAPQSELSESFRMSGAGDADAAHDLRVGTYQCAIALENNVVGERPQPFRLQFLSRDQIGAPLLSWTQASASTSTFFVLYGRAQSDTSRLEVKLRAAPLGQWTLQCDRSGDVLISSREYINMGGLVTVTGSGTDRFAMPVQEGTYVCRMRVVGNYAEDGRAAQFVVEMDGQLAIEIEASDWQGEVEYVVAAGAEARPLWVDVTAAELADWRVSCSPPLG